MTRRRKPFPGIPLWDYINQHPWPFVRNQLDRGELRYTWTDSDNNARASDDGGRVPPRGWWPRPEFTRIDEQSSVSGNAQIPPFFPPMYFVRVFPVVAPKAEAKAKGRPSVKFDLVLAILTDIKPAPGLLPAEIEKMVKPEFRRRWAKLKPDDDTGGSVSRRRIYEAYQQYLEDLSAK